MNNEKMFFSPLPEKIEEQELLLADGEIEGTSVRYINIVNSFITAPMSEEYIRIFLICEGKIEFQQKDICIKLEKNDVYVAAPQYKIKLSSEDKAAVLELRRNINKQEYAVLCDEEALPYFMRYEEAEKYTEDCKSPKTTSRMLIPARIVPRFAMGSVQTSGDDLVEKHKHPMLEQFFYGLSDNECTILIDEMELPFHKNTLLHIPLGSNHGIRSQGDQKVHYIWMDFLFDESGYTYMDDQHKIIKNGE